MSDYEKCLICGSVLTTQSSMARRIGPECYSALRCAQSYELSKDENFKLEYNWLIKVRHLQDTMTNYFQNKKFRSEFKKSFVPAFISAERVSKKMYEIAYNMCEQEHNGFNDRNLNYGKCTPFVERFEKIVDELKENYRKEKLEAVPITTAMIECARRYIKDQAK
jgi:hypothetical protein